MEGSPFSTPNLDRVAISWPSFLHFYVMVISCFSFSFICILRSSFTTSFLTIVSQGFELILVSFRFCPRFLQQSRRLYLLSCSWQKRELQFGTVTCLVRKMKKKKKRFSFFDFWDKTGVNLGTREHIRAESLMIFFLLIFFLIFDNFHIYSYTLI